MKTVPSGLSSLKSKINKLDIGKLETTPTDLSKPKNAVKKEVVKKTEYDELVEKINAIDTSKLVNKTDHNAKIKNIKDKILSITNLAITDCLASVENKIPNGSTLVKKGTL